MTENASRIREFRKARGLTAKQLAEQIGLSAAQMSRLERGKRRLSTHWMEKIADVLGVSMKDLLLDENSPEVSKVVLELQLDALEIVIKKIALELKRIKRQLK